MVKLCGDLENTFLPLKITLQKIKFEKVVQ